MIDAMAPTLGPVIEIDRTLAWAVGIAAVLVAVGGLVVWWRLRRALARRLATAALRLEPSTPAKEPRGVEQSLRRLERAVDDAAAAGRVDGIEETLLREIAERAPVGPAIAGLQALSGDDSAQGLIALLAEVSDGDLPGIEQLLP